MTPAACLGIVDWGIGGIGLVRELDRRVPGLPVLYWSDAGAVPYGRMRSADLTARLYLQRTGVTASGTVMEAISTSNATTGSLFRYDTTGDQYIFNLATKTLSTGAYQLRVDLGDGVPHTLNISLR